MHLNAPQNEMGDVNQIWNFGRSIFGLKYLHMSQIQYL